MNYKYNEELGIFEVEEEVVVELSDVKSWFEAFEEVADELEREDICLPFDELIKEDEEFLEYVINKTNNKVNNTNKYVSIIALKEFIGDLTPKNTFKGDNMAIKIYKEEELDKMTNKQYDALGCIYEDVVEEQKDITYINKSEVIMALVNKYNVDLRNTDEYKKLIRQIKDNKTPVNTNTFYNVLYNQLFEWDCPMIDLGKNIQIECVTEDASFGYDYGSISSVHHCSIIIGYNIKVEDID